MKVAVTIWENRISPLFDSTRMLLIVEVENRRITGKRREPFECESAFSRAAKLEDLGIGVLICGGISDFFARLIEAHNIHLIPFAAGEVEEILDAYMHDRLSEQKYRMPGCDISRDGSPIEDD